MVWVVSSGRQPSTVTLSLSCRMIFAIPTSDFVPVPRTRAIRVPPGEILNAVTGADLFLTTGESISTFM